jgi:hypothetical protein
VISKKLLLRNIIQKSTLKEQDMVLSHTFHRKLIQNHSEHQERS